LRTNSSWRFWTACRNFKTALSAQPVDLQVMQMTFPGRHRYALWCVTARYRRPQEVFQNNDAVGSLPLLRGEAAKSYGLRENTLAPCTPYFRACFRFFVSRKQSRKATSPPPAERRRFNRSTSRYCTGRTRPVPASGAMSPSCGGPPGRSTSTISAKALSLSGTRHNRQIVAYCRGPYCVLALEAVDLLRARRLRAVRL
jgi:hypothetical protein